MFHVSTWEIPSRNKETAASPLDRNLIELWSEWVKCLWTWYSKGYGHLSNINTEDLAHYHELIRNKETAASQLDRNLIELWSRWVKCLWTWYTKGYGHQSNINTEDLTHYHELIDDTYYPLLHLWNMMDFHYHWHHHLLQRGGITVMTLRTSPIWRNRVDLWWRVLTLLGALTWMTKCS